jgi:diguanylate cyclase
MCCRRASAGPDPQARSRSWTAAGGCTDNPGVRLKDLLDRFQSDLPVRWRLIAMLTMAFLVFAVICAVLWKDGREYRAAVAAGASEVANVTRLRNAQTAFGEYRYWQLAQLAGMIDERADLRAQARVRMELSYQKFLESLDAASSGAPESVRAVRSQLGALSDLQSQLNAVLAATNPQSLEPFAAEFRARLDSTYDALAEAAERAAGAAAHSRAQSSGLDWSLVLGALSLALLLLTLAVRSLVRPLESLVAGAQDLGLGKLDSPLPTERGDELGTLARAIDGFRDATRRWDYLAYHDSLTGLGNRTRLQKVLAEEGARAHRDGKAMVLLYVGLDQFTNISDTIGPAVGDEILRLAARRLTSCSFEGAQMFYLGSLHFAVLVTPLSNDARLLAAAEQFGRVLVSELSRPFNLQDHEMDMAVNVGIVTSPQDGTTYDELIGNAHAALAHSRKRSGNGFHFYTRSLTDKARGRLALASQLRRAVESDELQLHYQPILDVAANRIVCAEALIRWQHPTRGLIMPGEFIQVAEESGVINAMGEWALTKAALDTRRWRAAGVAPIKLAVNLSARQLNEPGLVDGIQRTLESTGASASELELEITESAMMMNPERSARVMRHLKSIGITLSMDDFGTGYSSLTYLQHFPLDKIKIDRSFVSRLNRRRKDELIIAATTSLAADLGLSVVAEGVETKEQMETLRHLGCAVMQGYLFSRGLPLDEFVAWANKPRNYAALESARLN